jgi:hypothetical protein
MRYFITAARNAVARGDCALLAGMVGSSFPGFPLSKLSCFTLRDCNKLTENRNDPDFRDIIGPFRGNKNVNFGWFILE